MREPAVNCMTRAVDSRSGSAPAVRRPLTAGTYGWPGPEVRLSLASRERTPSSCNKRPAAGNIPPHDPHAPLTSHDLLSGSGKGPKLFGQLFVAAEAQCGAGNQRNWGSAMKMLMRTLLVFRAVLIRACFFIPASCAGLWSAPHRMTIRASNPCIENKFPSQFKGRRRNTCRLPLMMPTVCAPNAPTPRQCPKRRLCTGV